MSKVLVAKLPAGLEFGKPNAKKPGGRVYKNLYHTDYKVGKQNFKWELQ